MAGSCVQTALLKPGVLCGFKKKAFGHLLSSEERNSPAYVFFIFFSSLWFLKIHQCYQNNRNLRKTCFLRISVGEGGGLERQAGLLFKL